MKKLVNGQEVDLSPEEEAAILAEWAAEASKPPPVDPRKTKLEQAGFSKSQVEAILSII